MGTKCLRAQRISNYLKNINLIKEKLLIRNELVVVLKLKVRNTEPVSDVPTAADVTTWRSLIGCTSWLLQTNCGFHTVELIVNTEAKRSCVCCTGHWLISTARFRYQKSTSVFLANKGFWDFLTLKTNISDDHVGFSCNGWYPFFVVLETRELLRKTLKLTE